MDVGIESSSTGVLTLRRTTLHPPTILEDTLLGKCGDAAEVLRTSRRQGLLVWPTMRYPRHSRWQDVVDMRGHVTAYHAQPPVIRLVEGRLV